MIGMSQYREDLKMVEDDFQMLELDQNDLRYKSGIRSRHPKAGYLLSAGAEPNLLAKSRSWHRLLKIGDFPEFL